MKACLTAALVVLLASAASAQFKKGDFEMMLLGTVGSHTETTKVTYTGTSGFTVEDDDTHSYAYFSLSPAYYFIDRLAAELELGVRASEGDKPAQTAILHLAYTHPLPRSSVALFARAGYGVSNGYTVPIFYEQVRSTQDFDISIINLGAGAKFMLGRTALLRAEINYRIQSWSEEDGNFKGEWTRNTLALLLGVGVVL